MKIGILREEKIPKDSRVPLTPSQCRNLMERFNNVWIAVQPSAHRCYSNEEYLNHGIPLKEDLSDCDLLIGVKEIPPHLLIPHKTYMIFSHTIKEQPHNRKLMRAALEKKITLIDWECLKDEKGKRLIAFGRWAGIVGAYHAIRMIGLHTKRFYIKPLSECHNFAEGQKEFARLDLPPWKIVLTGTGRVSGGAAFLMDIMGIRKVSPADFLRNAYDEVVYTQLTSADMYGLENSDQFNSAHFHAHPEEYTSMFFPYTRTADVMINGIYWDKRIPAFFYADRLTDKDFSIKILSDITCDIGREASVPTTIRASHITNPYYGVDLLTLKEIPPFTGKGLDVMAIDNLPDELPRDASEDFGNMLTAKVLPEFFQSDSAIIRHATICSKGTFTNDFTYLKGYVSPQNPGE